MKFAPGLDHSRSLSRLYCKTPREEEEKKLLTLIPPWMYERGVSKEGIGTTDVNPGEERSAKGEACGVILCPDRSDFAKTPQSKESGIF